MFKLNNENEKYYEILNKLIVEEYNLEMYELVHKATKAKILLFDCDDENRVFNIVFKTPVDNSKGMPHILEHSVLCGSRKYNIKDPFVELAKGSMHTFLNAMTYPDKTCYPVASANIKDFHNLVDVYLDAVFYPNVCKDERIFMQEGWHYEIEDINSPLKVNGVVYNEMKGVYSDPDSILMSSIQKSLFAGTNYEHESGGRPEDIINLTYEEFIRFHDTYYSASNSTICFYGKLDFNYELEYLQNEYLKDMRYVDCNPKFTNCNKDKIISESVDYYNCDTEDTLDKSYISYSFSLGNMKDTISGLMLFIIDDYLFNDNTGILKEKLLKEGYGETVSSGFEMSEYDTSYNIVVQNINENKKEKLIEIIDETFKKLYENGFDKDMIDGALNTWYFKAVEDSSEGVPIGLKTIINFFNAYLYGQDYSNIIGYKKAFDYAFEMNLNDKSNLLFNLLKKCFIDNDLKCVNILKPKFGLAKEKDDKVAELLSDRKKKMTVDEINKFIEQNKKLKEYQSTVDKEEDKKCIPSLQLEDFDDYKEFYTYKYSKQFGIDTIIDCNLKTDIIYFSLYFRIDKIVDEDIYYSSLFLDLIGTLDTKSMGYKDFYNYTSKNVGKIIIDFVSRDGKYYFVIHVRTTMKKLAETFNVVYMHILEQLFNDKNRIKMIVNENKLISYGNILSSGHISSTDRAKSKINSENSVSDKVRETGIAHYQFLKDFVNSYDNNSKLYNEILTNLYRKIANCDLILFASISEKNYSGMLIEFEKFYNKLEEYRKNNRYSDEDYNNLKQLYIKTSDNMHYQEYEMKSNSEAIITTNDINFCALAGSYNKSNFKGNELMLISLFNFDYLWNNIRVKNGAYGCGARITENGVFDFYSYRDPNLINTYNIYMSVNDYISKINLTNDDLIKTIIKAMAAYDNPISNYAKFMSTIDAYFHNRSNESRNKHRKSVLNSKVDDLRKFTNIYDDIKNSNYKCALICEKDKGIAKKEFDVVWELKQ